MANKPKANTRTKFDGILEGGQVDMTGKWTQVTDHKVISGGSGLNG